MLYRLYKLAKDGHLFGLPEVLEASDDKQEIKKARVRSSGFDLELWFPNRRIALIRRKRSREMVLLRHASALHLPCRGGPLRGHS